MNILFDCPRFVGLVRTTARVLVLSLEGREGESRVGSIFYLPVPALGVLKVVHMLGVVRRTVNNPTL